eukprot:gene12539-14818_t
MILRSFAVSMQPWADHFTCARKPTPDVLAEYGLLTVLPSGGYGISSHLRAMGYRELQRTCPNAQFYINRRAPSAREVCEEMKQMVCGDRACMDGYASKSPTTGRRTSGPTMEHGPHPNDDNRPANWCKKTAQGFCKSCFQRPCGITRRIENGFIELKRRVGGQIRCSWTAGDEFNVPYNPWMLFKYRTHINVEIAAKVSVIAYLYKYLFKGGDRARYEEAEIAMTEAVMTYTTPFGLFSLFVVLTMNGYPTEKMLNAPEHQFIRDAMSIEFTGTTQEKQQKLLKELTKHFESNGKNLSDYGITEPTACDMSELTQHRAYWEEQHSMMQNYLRDNNLFPEQQRVADRVKNLALQRPDEGSATSANDAACAPHNDLQPPFPMFFLDGPAGTGDYRQIAPVHVTGVGNGTHIKAAPTDGYDTVKLSSGASLVDIMFIIPEDQRFTGIQPNYHIRPFVDI